MKPHYDVVVAGAGPAGLAAARAAAGEGARVAILDDNPRPGGQIWRQGPIFPAAAPLVDALDALRASGVELVARARVVAALPDRTLLVDTASGGAPLRYERLVMATGARELLLPFTGWTLPGVTGAGGLQALIKSGVPVRGERVVIAGSGPLLVAAYATARAAGARVVAVLEQAPARAVRRFGLSLLATPSKLWQAAKLTRGFVGSEYLTGSVVRAALGSTRVEAVRIERAAADGRSRVIECDRIACGYGLLPNLTLARALGCEIRNGAVVVDARQRSSLDAIYAAGECTGVGGMELARVEGAIAGLAAAGVAAHAARFAPLVREREVWRGFAARAAATFALGDAARALPPDDTLLCRCEDVTIGAARGHADARDAKLLTRCGMGACQGRVCGAAAGVLLGWQEATPRPPFAPVRIGTLAACADDALR